MVTYFQMIRMRECSHSEECSNRVWIFCVYVPVFLINYKPNSYTVWVDWSSNQLLSIGLCYPYISYLLTEIIHNFFAVHQAKSVQLIFITINIEIFNHNRPEKSEIGQANEIEKSGKFVAKMVLASWEMLALLKIKETYEKPVARINGRIWDANANLSH